MENSDRRREEGPNRYKRELYTYTKYFAWEDQREKSAIFSIKLLGGKLKAFRLLKIYHCSV